MARLNAEQRRAAEHPGGPLMVLAGAGSGKTRVLVHRIARLVSRGVRPHAILAVTFTNKAAGEMRDRLEQMLGAPARSMWVSTFHSTCARLLRLFHEDAGIARDFSIYDDDDQKKIINAILKEEGLDDSIGVRSVMALIDRAKNRGDDPVEAYIGHYAEDIMRVVYPRYAERMAREDAVDFNDLLLKVLELEEHPRVGPRLASMFEHVLVDEFQDTNLVQFRLVRHLVSKTRNLTVVGDDDQSIYSWRGAEPRNLLDFDREFSDATAIKLEQNYRSTAMILGAANGIISHNFDRHDKALWTEREGGEPVLWEEHDDERGEASFIARAITAMVSEEQRPLGGIAILYRTHAQSRVLEETLRAHSLPYRIVGGVSFFQRKEIKDIRAYLRLATSRQADLAFERIVNTPTRGIGKTTVERLKGFARQTGCSLFDAALAAGRGQIPSIKGAAAKKVSAFTDIVEGIGRVAGAGASVAEVIIQAVERSSYRERLEADDTPESRDRLQNLAELVSMATDFDEETDGQGTLEEFEERISLAGTADQDDGRSGDVVTMMTIHAAKGLEFPVVFVAGMEDGLFPSLRERERGQDAERELEEERRLAYVAFTRAEDRLILTSARTRRQWNEVRINRPSRFLDEVPREFLTSREPEVGGIEVDMDEGWDQWDDQPRQRRRGLQAETWDEFDQRTHYPSEGDDVPDFDVDDEPDRQAGPGGSGPLRGPRSGGGRVPPEVTSRGSGDPPFVAGGRVRHSALGVGQVVEARGSGADLKLLINFEKAGLKTVMARWVELA